MVLAGCTPQYRGGALPTGPFIGAARERLASPEPPLVATQVTSAYINVGTLAARHPAWKLAESLEKPGTSPTGFDSIDAPQAPRGLSLQSASLEPDAEGTLPNPAGEDETPLSGAPGYERPPQRLTARAATALEDQARQQQEGALATFLQDVATYQKNNRDDEMLRLDAELKDKIEAAQRLSLANLQPLQPPAAAQLEMTNLRIKLLSNTKTTPEGRERAQARLNVLEAEWRVELRRQENARLAELRRLLTEVPEQMNQAGQVNITEVLNARSARDDALRERVANALRERVSAGFGPDDRAPLFVQLPGASLPVQSLGEGPDPSLAPFLRPAQPALPAASKSILEINSTFRPVWPSTSAFTAEVNTMARVPAQPATRPLSASQQRVATLRRQALTEAKRWAQSIARRRNWQLQARRTTAEGNPVPDRTGEALQLLNL